MLTRQDNNDNNNNNFSQPVSFPPPPLLPTQLTEDELAQVIYSIVTLIFGSPLNIYAFCKNVRRLRSQMNRRPGGQNRRKGRKNISKAAEMVMLILNLNISDLLILNVYLPTQIVWKLTIQWHGGEALCRFLRFMHQFCFHLSSYTVVCIATERLMTVMRRRIVIQKRSIKTLLAGTWIISFICAIPTFLVWTTIRPFANVGIPFTQCTTIFQGGDLEINGPSDIQYWEMMYLAYSVGGILSVFWLPACYITVAYSYIFLKLRQIGKNQPLRTTVKKLSQNGGQRNTFQKHFSRVPTINFEKVDTVVTASHVETSRGSDGDNNSCAGGIGLHQIRHHLSPLLTAPKPTTNKQETSDQFIPTSDQYNKNYGNAHLHPFPNCDDSNVSLNSIASSSIAPTAVVASASASLGSFSDSEKNVAFSTTLQPKWRQQLRSKETVFTKTGLVVLVYMSCWLPYFAASLLPGLNLKILGFLIGLNAAVNPIIYAFDP